MVTHSSVCQNINVLTYKLLRTVSTGLQTACLLMGNYIKAKADNRLTLVFNIYSTWVNIIKARWLSLVKLFSNAATTMSLKLRC